ncbi:MAG: hypothetical protein E3J35_06430 [Methanomassiliicoccales archaeon]|nr:MAG: hypothetical protein E3J35_06430 [Methanomassiliicoccales archaeon]
MHDFALLKCALMTACVFLSSSNSTLGFEDLDNSDEWIIEEVVDLGELLLPWSPDSVNRTSIVLNSSGMPHIAFQDIGTGEIRYAYRNATGKWQTETVVNAEMKGVYAVLALDSNDRPVICYRNVRMRELSCAFSEASGWRYEVVDDTPDAGAYVSLALDNLDRPHLAYYINHGDLRYAWLDGMTWNITTLRDRTAGEVLSLSLDLDSKYDPHIALVSSSPERGLWYYRWNETKWDKEIVGSLVRGYHLYSMALNNSDLPHMAFLDSSERVPRYAYNDGTYWFVRSIDVEAEARHGSFFLDSNQNPHVAYEERGQSDIRYAYMDGGLWNKETVDGEGLVGLLPSVTADSNGIPSLSYIDLTNLTLKYATKKEEIEADIDIDPDTLNLKSRGKWITCYIELLAGYDPRNINASTILLNDVLKPELNPKYGFVVLESSYIMDHDEDGILERMIKFDRSEVQELLSPGDSVSIRVTGQLFDGTKFEGTDKIRVINPPQLFSWKYREENPRISREVDFLFPEVLHESTPYFHPNPLCFR